MKQYTAPEYSVHEIVDIIATSVSVSNTQGDPMGSSNLDDIIKNRTF